MKKTGSKTFRYEEDGVHVLGLVNVADAAAEGGAESSRTSVSSRQRVRVVQHGEASVLFKEARATGEQTARAGDRDHHGKEEGR
ncbi:MAG TPA: hypothetical protein VHF67_09280 [Gaiellaceae bacterium]|nr:hypothetical protein [Gaiellaceae bacterium]